jgi:hypothetical protein
MINKYAFLTAGFICLYLFSYSLFAQTATDLECANCVDRSDIAAKAISEAKIGNSAVTTDKIRAGAVTTNKIGAGSVSRSKIRARAITEGKLSADLQDRLNGIEADIDTLRSLIPKTGLVIVNNDDRTLQNEGFTNAASTPVFVANMASLFMPAGPGKFHAYSDDAAFTGQELADAFAAGGHTWTTGANIDPLDLPTYDGIFVGGTPIDNEVLVNYVESGGNVYLVGGTGGNAQAEADQWNPFLNFFGFRFGSVYNGIIETKNINSVHPLFTGVTELWFSSGNSVSDLSVIDERNSVLVSSNTDGLISIYDRRDRAVAP